jgi:hypothetical protein
MRHYLILTVVAAGFIAALFAQLTTGSVTAQMASQSAAVFDSKGRMKMPDPKVFRRWVFLGSPLTPDGLNGGSANFPEFHNVYVEQKNLEAHLKTDSFPEGTVLVKELTRVLKPTFPDGSREEPSGRGYFNGQFNGMDVAVKDSKRFAKTNGWGFFNFGHHPLPYEEWTEEASVSECAGCHIANVAKTDMTWVQFYPLLRDHDPVK